MSHKSKSDSPLFHDPARTEHKDGHVWLAQETAKDPVSVDTDRPSHGWSGPVPVKREPPATFKDTPSPRPKKMVRVNGPPNPDFLPGLLSAGDTLTWRQLVRDAIGKGQRN